ncbi:GNAT family N-acetyltransferase [Streptomyces sp. NPDC049627]|uniref:GNAT family N-acetyltransferase n=1 Tax=Streptomyces sp. NPDC049627 TaxID=3365595 RepID=UPI0037B96BE2
MRRRAATMISMLPSAMRLARYTTTERDEITGGAVDPSGVAVTGLTWLDKEVHFGVRHQGRLVAHAGWVQVPLSVDAVRLPAAGLGGVVVAPDMRGRGWHVWRWRRPWSTPAVSASNSGCCSAGRG